MGVKVRTLKDIRTDVALATVKVLARGSGQGVLVANGFVITAAHCLAYDGDVGERLALGDHILYEIETAQGVRIKLSPYIIEPCRDIAVLGPLDGQSFPAEIIEPYESFLRRTKPVRLCRKRFDRPATGAGAHIQFGVHIRTHKEAWITGKATVLHEHSPTMFIDSDEGVEGGTSGGPIVNDAGELVGVVSIIGGRNEGGATEGPCPVPRWALPAWIYSEITGRR